MVDALIGTAIPILLLIGIGFFQEFRIIKQEYERARHVCLFFVLPTLFSVDLPKDTLFQLLSMNHSPLVIMTSDAY